MERSDWFERKNTFVKERSSLDYPRIYNPSQSDPTLIKNKKYFRLSKIIKNYKKMIKNHQKSSKNIKNNYKLTKIIKNYQKILKIIRNY